MDGQLLGIALQAGSSSCAELKEITSGSPRELPERAEQTGNSEAKRDE